jgi:hypothetical protein
VRFSGKLWAMVATPNGHHSFSCTVDHKAIGPKQGATVTWRLHHHETRGVDTTQEEEMEADSASAAGSDFPSSNRGAPTGASAGF